jgi:hypothetical protein
MKKPQIGALRRYAILGLLADTGPLTTIQIAEHLPIPPTALATALAELGGENRIHATWPAGPRAGAVYRVVTNLPDIASVPAPPAPTTIEPLPAAGRIQAYLNARAARLAPPHVVDSQDKNALTEADLRALMAGYWAQRDATQWYRPEAVNAAAGSAHRITLSPVGVTKVEHHIGCYEHGARRRRSGTPLICPFEHYLDAIDAEDTPAPAGVYWVTVEVFGRADESPASTWERVDAPDGPGAYRSGYDKAIADACRAWGIRGAEDLVDDGPWPWHTITASIQTDDSLGANKGLWSLLTCPPDCAGLPPWATCWATRTHKAPWIPTTEGEYRIRPWPEDHADDWAPGLQIQHRNEAGQWAEYDEPEPDPTAGAVYINVTATTATGEGAGAAITPVGEPVDVKIYGSAQSTGPYHHIPQPPSAPKAAGQ